MTTFGPAVSARSSVCAMLCGSLVAAAFLSGCSASFAPQLAKPTPGTSSLAGIQGSVFGGQQPIVGAHIYVYSAGGKGYGSRSQSLLTNVTTGAFPTTDDGTGNYYITTDSGGRFTLTGEYTCGVGSQVYLYSIGGDPGNLGVSNPNAGLMSVLGTCPSDGTFAGHISFINMNEVSTVAAAFAMAGFALDAQHVGSADSPGSVTGLANAFANAANLYDLSGGHGSIALVNTPAGNGNVPQRKINSLANSLAGCVNTAGNTTACNRLFKTTTNASGNTATDTATFAIYLAQKPFTDDPSDVATVFNTAAALPPFVPTLSSHPTDWAIALTFAGGGMKGPSELAADADGNMWITSQNADTLTKLSPLGAVLSPSDGFTDGLAGPLGVAVDPSGNVWVANSNGASVAKFSNDGTLDPNAPFDGSHKNGGIFVDGFVNPSKVAVDGAGTVWVTDTDSSGNTDGFVLQLNGNGSYLNTSSDSIEGPIAIAIGNLKEKTQDYAASVVNTLTPSLITLAQDLSVTSTLGIPKAFVVNALAVDVNDSRWFPAGAANRLGRADADSNPTSFDGGGLNAPYGVAVDGAGTIWVSNEAGNTLSAFDNNGNALTPAATGYVAANLVQPHGVAVDGSGNVWLANSGSNTVSEFIGAATPVVTPLSLAARNRTLGTRP